MDARRTLSWPEAIAFFRSDPAHARLLEVAGFLAASRYARSLFPVASQGCLALGRVPDFQPEDNELRIAFDAAAQQFVFTHYKAAGAGHPWSRECDPSEWQAVLERIFHKRLNWFHEG